MRNLSKISIVAAITCLGIFSPFKVMAQKDTPCECTQRWTRGGHWNTNGTVNDSPTAPNPLGIIRCGSSAETQSSIKANGCVYNASQFPIIPAGCKNPDTSLPVNVNPPTAGCPVIWVNIDQRPAAGSYQYQIVSSEAYSWALYYSTEHQAGTDISGLSGDCGSLAYYACGNSFSGWATFTTPSFLPPTNLYIAIWRTTGCGTQTDFSISFKARFGCGDADIVLCNVESGNPTTSCNANSTYTVNIPIFGINGNYQGYDPNATPTTSNVVTLKNIGSGGPINGTITMTYPQSVSSYNVLIKDIILATGDIIPSNPDSCVLNVTGNGLICDDGDPLSTDICSNGNCIHTCNDNNVCTLDEYINNHCVFTSVNCGDGDECTEDNCHPITGCTNTLLNCDDGDPLSVDECFNGTCIHTCNDNDVCTSDAYDNGHCVFSPINCDDNEACTEDGCNPSTGCTHNTINCDDGNPESEDACENGTCIHTCDDGNACTSDSYANGNCVFSPINCNDGDACTTDNCNPATGCTFPPLNCDDGNPQTLDACENGICTHTCYDGNLCTNDFLNGAGKCVFQQNTCSDGNACTNDNCNPATGACTSTPINCDDGNPQSVDACVNGVCVHTCNDGNACTQDSYVNGNCVFSGGNCNDNNACTQNICNPATGCSNPPINCDDGNPNTNDFCENGTCVHTSCNDNNPCTTDNLVNGNCVFTPINCDDGNPQSVDACVNGVCTHTCNDGNACTIDSYVNGNCVFTPDCNDNNVCTMDNCVNSNCQHPPVCSDDNNPCTDNFCRNSNGVAVCIYSQIDCSDNVACTIDDCNSSNGNCTHDAAGCNNNLICPPKMIIVLDESGSIAGYGQGSVGVTTQVRNGVAGMFSALSETDIDVAVIEFNTRARRAVINGTTAYQQITPGNLNSFLAYVNDNNTTPESNHFDPEDYLSNTTNAFTNWDDALKLVQTINTSDGLAPLVLFFTDGKPTAYNNSNGTVTTGTSTSAVAEALSRAVASANIVKTQGAHIFVVAFPNPGLTESTVQAISGPQRYPDIQPDFTKADYSIESSSSLENSLKAIAGLLCRADIRLSASVNPAAACPGATVIFKVKVTNDGLDKADVVEVKDYLPSGYTYVSDNKGAASTFASGIITWNVGTLLNTKSDSILITAVINQSGDFRNVAEVTYSNKDDSDSQPGNFSLNPDEDDEAALSVSFQGCNGGGGCTSNTQCNDANSCTVDVCSGGVCQNTAVSCNDNNVCTTDACNPASGCTYTAITNCNNNDPCSGVNCDDGNPCTSDACSNGSCTHTPLQSGPSYLKIVNTAKSWRKLKLGYSPTNLYSPMQNVTAGGNNQMCITLRSVGTPEWSKIQVRPQGSSTAAVVLSNYISGSIASFTTFCIPLSAFTGYNFSSISYMEIPYSNGANAFEIHISKIQFTGGTTSFLWFGDPHTNNIHDGQSGSTSALTATLIPGSPCGAKLSGENQFNEGNLNSVKTFISAYPNPFNDELNFEFSLPDDSDVSLELFSINGAKISTILEGKVKGSHIYKEVFRPDDLARGIYLYRLKTNATSVTEKVILAK